MAHQQQDLRWFDFVLRVHNVLVFGGMALFAVWLSYSIGGEWISGAITNAPDWIVFSGLYSEMLLRIVVGTSVRYWFIAIPAIYAVAIWITRKLWY